MSDERVINFKSFYQNFNFPITHFDCGEKCSPYNEYGVPFCCDIRHAVPSAYHHEWIYLKENTDLWHIWDSENLINGNHIRSITPDDQVLIECLGYKHCQRSFRSITCRAFPFFPYITLSGDFIGMSYYWQYEERCWVVNNLDHVSNNFRQGFQLAYDKLFNYHPQDFDNFRYHSIVMRR